MQNLELFLELVEIGAPLANEMGVVLGRYGDLRMRRRAANFRNAPLQLRLHRFQLGRRSLNFYADLVTLGNKVDLDLVVAKGLRDLPDRRPFLANEYPMHPLGRHHKRILIGRRVRVHHSERRAHLHLLTTQRDRLRIGLRQWHFDRNARVAQHVLDVLAFGP